MTRCGEFRNLATGILGSFVSRNNDVDGYWCFGVLRAFADRKRCKTLRFDLVRQTAEPADSLTRMIAVRYGDVLRRQLVHREIASDAVPNAELQVDFHVQVSALASLPTYGDPARCSFVLLDDRGRECCLSVVTACAPHNPERELRSSRAVT